MREIGTLICWATVYNKLEDCIKDGYFVVYTYSGHKTIRLADVGIMEYTKRIA